MSPWNSPVFVIKKPNKDKWRLLTDLRKINELIVDMGPLQPGMPSPAMLPQNWILAVIDIKDCFFQIPLHPDDALCFAFTVPSVNCESPAKRYHWRVLPQGMKNSPVICQWYVASLLSPIRTALGDAVIVHHYMDDILLEKPQVSPSDCLCSRQTPSLPFPTLPVLVEESIWQQHSTVRSLLMSALCAFPGSSRSWDRNRFHPHWHSVSNLAACSPLTYFSNNGHLNSPRLGAAFSASQAEELAY
nr:uncharacterized protein LOC106629199 [Zonotrichia albicollis]